MLNTPKNLVGIVNTEEKTRPSRDLPPAELPKTQDYSDYCKPSRQRVGNLALPYREYIHNSQFLVTITFFEDLYRFDFGDAVVYQDFPGAVRLLRELQRLAPLQRRGLFSKSPRQD